MFDSSIRLLGNISEKTINLVTPVTKLVKGIPNAFAIGYTQSKLNRHAKARYKAEHSIALAQAKSRMDSKESEIDFA
jgi:hypothetical protein|tara:strand:+ start:1341 stop:1571 length:231 start_codon:yes stop_codon:yes gene_type:complete